MAGASGPSSHAVAPALYGQQRDVGVDEQALEGLAGTRDRAPDRYPDRLLTPVSCVSCVSISPPNRYLSVGSDGSPFRSPYGSCFLHRMRLLVGVSERG
jgi:hypothetical protein